MNQMYTYSKYELIQVSTILVVSTYLSVSVDTHSHCSLRLTVLWEIFHKLPISKKIKMLKLFNMENIMAG